MNHLKISFFLLFVNLIFGHTIVENDGRWKEILNRLTQTNEIEREANIDDDCPNLTSDLIKEIASYEPIVNKIVAAAVNGKYSGDTWNA